MTTSPGQNAPPPLPSTLRRLTHDARRFLRRFRRLALLALIGLCVILLPVVTSWIVLEVRGALRLRAAGRAAVRADVPLTWEAWNAKYPPVADSKNAALYYEAAFKVSQVADRHEMEIDLLHAGSFLPESRYTIGKNDPLPPLSHLGSARHAARLLRVSALLAAYDNDAVTALARVRDGLALSRSLSREPFLCSNLVAVAIASITVSESLQPVLSYADVPESKLAALQKELQEYARNFSMRPCLDGEAVLTCRRFDWVITGKGNVAEPYKKDTPLSAIPRRLRAGFFKADEAAAIGYYLRLIAAEEDFHTIPEIKNLDNRMEKEVAGSPYILSRCLLPGLCRALITGLRHRSRLEAAAAGIAALRFYNDRGEWPDSLDALVPEYLDAVPIDPATSAPLVYCRVEDGIMIYSVGENGVDDGGAAGSDDRHVMFALRRPPHGGATSSRTQTPGAAAGIAQGEAP